MRAFRSWILPLAFAIAAWAALADGRPGAGLRPALAIVFLALGLACTGDLAVRATWPGLPLYRRHLLLFGLLGLAAAVLGPPGHRLPAIGLAALGAAAGLALTCLPALRTRRLACLGWVRGAALRPDPAAPLILVADPHWSEALTNLRETAAAHPAADWLFLGDVFDAWVGIEGMGSPLQADFLAWVDEHRRSGHWVGFWLGNREFFLDGLSGHFDLMGEGTAGGLPQEGLAWEHGDLINTLDWRYRLWNLAARSGAMWLFAQSLPKPAARALAHWVHRALKTTNRAYKLTFPREAFRAAAAEHPSEVFITGHFHTHETEGHGIALPWAHEGNFMVWIGGEVKPLAPWTHL